MDTKNEEANTFIQLCKKQHMHKTPISISALELIINVCPNNLHRKGKVKVHHALYHYTCLWGASERKLGKSLKPNQKARYQNKSREKG